METAVHIECRSCGSCFEIGLSEYPCPECGGFLDPKYDLTDLSIARETLEDRSGSMWKYWELLPIQEKSSIISLGEGITPLIDCPDLADKYNIGGIIVKDEGQNPTSTFKDRGASVTMSGLQEHGIDEACIISVGNAGHAAAAYAARANITCHIYLTEDRGELATTMMQAHGAKLHLGEGFTSTKRQMDTACKKYGWTPLSPFNAPFRHEGKKTMGLELFEQLDWSPPDHIVYPTGGGVGVIGIWKAFQHYRDLGWLESGTIPSLHAAQTEGCAPIVRALEKDADKHTPWKNPNSIARGVMNPDPSASKWIIECIRDSGGTGVAVSDQAAVDASLAILSQEGIEMGVTSSVALAGTFELVERGDIDKNETVVVINTGAAGKSYAELARYLPDLN